MNDRPAAIATPRVERRAARWARAGCGLLLAAWPRFDNGFTPALTARGAPPVPPAELARGQRLLVQYQCGRCHQIPAVSQGQGQTAPTLARLGRRSYIAGQVPNTASTLARWIENPAAVVPGTTMPAMGVPPADAQAMAAYLLAQR
jgi:cytochrome c